MTYEERLALTKKCRGCEYTAKRELPYNIEGEPIMSKFSREKKYGRKEFLVCKMLNLLCCEIANFTDCPLDGLTEEEIEQREGEYDNQDLEEY